MNANYLTTPLATTLLTLALAVPAKADHRYAEDLALQLQGQAGQLSAEIRGNFRYAPNFPQLISESQQLYGLSAQVRALTRANVNPRTIEGIVHRMDGLVHRLEDSLDDAQHSGGHHGHHGYHGRHCDTRHAQRLLLSIDRTIITLDDVLHDQVHQVRAQPRQDYDDNYGFQGQVPAVGPYYGNRGVSFGGRGISVQFSR